MEGEESEIRVSRLVLNSFDSVSSMLAKRGCLSEMRIGHTFGIIQLSDLTQGAVEFSDLATRNTPHIQGILSGIVGRPTDDLFNGSYGTNIVKFLEDKVWFVGKLSKHQPCLVDLHGMLVRSL